MRISFAALTTAAVCAATLTACGTQNDAGDNAEPTKKPAASQDAAIDCESEDLSQADWTKHCADDAGGEDAPDTDLKIGQPFTWDDGVKATVDNIEQVTKFSEYDSPPGEDQTAFRVNITFDNGSKKRVDLGEFSLIVEGATNGGEAEWTTFEDGSEEISGRLAPGVKDTKTDDYVLDNKYGKQVVVTVQKVGEDWDLFDSFPEWTGPIR